MKTVFTALSLYTPLEEIIAPVVVVEDGLITSVSSRTAQELPAAAHHVDFADEILAPGFVDIHIHGGAGLDVMVASATELPRLGKFLATHGVTAYFPTTVAAPLDQICTALDRISGAIETISAAQNGVVQARPLGIHLEGPFLSHKRRGVHPPENLIEPTAEIFEQFWQASRGHISVMTIAPELPGAMEVIAEAARRQVCVSIGHSNAELLVAREAVAAGARHATHTFNAMRPLDHRDPGIIAEVLTNDSITADIIADGIHLDPAIVQLFLRAKGTQRAVLITDAISATGMPNGRYQLGPMMVDVKDGKCTVNGTLAGSVLTMDRAVRNVTEFASWSLRDAVGAATLNAAQAVGVGQRHGRLAQGAEANFVVLSAAGEVRATVVGGQVSNGA
ncbi:MAG: N-acetylglucosamine-6-phosphate deacetylase [Candidatus Sulfotelmatobacter sp.]